MLIFRFVLCVCVFFFFLSLYNFSIILFPSFLLFLFSIGYLLLTKSTFSNCTCFKTLSCLEANGWNILKIKMLSALVICSSELFISTPNFQHFASKLFALCFLLSSLTPTSYFLPPSLYIYLSIYLLSHFLIGLFSSDFYALSLSSYILSFLLLLSLFFS